MATRTKTKTVPVVQMLPAQPSQNGVGALKTSLGNLPLTRMEVEADIVGIFASTTIRQTFKNPTDQALEAVYIFPLPDRAGVSPITRAAIWRNWSPSNGCKRRD